MIAPADGLSGLLSRAVQARTATLDSYAPAPPQRDPLLQRYVTNNRGTRMKDKDARNALIKQFNVPETDLESMAVIDAVISDWNPHTWSDVVKMMPAPRYLPSGHRETARHTGRPLGFASDADFQLFLHGIYSNLKGFARDAEVVFHGSSLTGQSFKDKGGSRLFDVGRDSDYDVAIASEKLFKLADELGVKIRGNHSEPLTREQIEMLGLGPAYELANFNARREVNFMLYASVKDAHQHEGPALVGTRAENYQEITASLHGNVG